MKVAHVCLSNYYMDDRAYQENELVEEHVRQGHEVLVIASTQNFTTDRRREGLERGLLASGNQLTGDCSVYPRT